jgi:N-dimethylarginine dimethylaminohydrolase
VAWVLINNQESAIINLNDRAIPGGTMEVTPADPITTAQFNGHSLVGSLQRVLVCSPRTAGWNRPEYSARWRDLGFHHAPDFAVAQAQHDTLCRELAAAGAEVMELAPAPELSLDAVYAHDASLATDFGLIVMRPGKPNRVFEGQHQGAFGLRFAVPTLAKIVAPGATEAGDILWLDAHTLLVGHGYRTNAMGIQQLRDLLGPKGVEVLSAPLPHGPGPAACLHLMSLISLLDEHTALVDLPWLAVETVELLKSRGFQFIEIDASERDSLACNVLALGNHRLLALEENHKTNASLRQAGFDLRTFPGSELCINGSGGPTCLTRPLLRS